MALKVIELEIDDTLSGDTRVEEIALVLQPAIETEFVYFSEQKFQESYSDYPEAVKNNAKKVLRWTEINGWGSCGTAVGKQRANQLAKGEPISMDTIKRMYSYLSRHKVDLQSSRSYEDGCGLLMYDSWGGEEALGWAERKIRQFEEMGYDLGNLSPWSQTSGTTQEFEKPCWEGYVMVGMKEKDGRMVPNCVPETQLSAYELDIFGYKTKFFYVCPGAQGTFKEIISITPTEDSIGMIRSAAVLADRIFQIETQVMNKQSATPEELKEAEVLLEDFQDIIQQIEKIHRKKYDVSYMNNHIEIIKSFVGKEMMYVDDSNCGCGCWNDGTYEDTVDNLYFGVTTINGIPVFESADEAATYAQTMGCNGSHKHIIDGVEMYMPCEVHPQPINEDDEMGEYSEEEFEAAKVLLELSKTDYQAFEAVVGSLRGATETEVKRRNHRTPTIYFKYERVLDGFPDRDFCVSIEGRYFRRLEIDLLRDFNTEFGHNREPYSKWLYKGGPNCVHAWRKYLVQGKDIVDQGFADGKAGTPPKSLPNNGYYSEETKKKSERAYAISQSQKMSRTASSAVVVDVDDTLIRGGAAIKKTADYVNRLWDNHRIVIVSGRQSSRTGATRSELQRAGIKFDEIHLSDFPQGPNASREFKVYKVKKLLQEGYNIVEAIENDAQTRREYTKLGVKAISPTSLTSQPDGFNGEYAIFKNKKDAEAHSEFCGCGGYVQEVVVDDQVMFQSCGEMLKKVKEQQFKYDGEKKMIYSPAMKPGILIPRIDEVTREKYFVTFKPETIEKMAQRYMIDKRSGGGHTNYEHSDTKFEDVYLVESWIVDGEQDKAYSLGYTKQQIPKGTWMVGFRVDSPEVWKMVKEGKIRGISIEGNFEYKFSSSNTDEYLLNEIINIINQIK